MKVVRLGVTALAAVAALLLSACGPAVPASSSAAAGTPAPATLTAARTATLLAVGDVGACPDGGRAVATLATRLKGPIALLGDIAYPNGSRSDYNKCFWPSWKPLRKRVRAVIGNHDDRNRATFFATWPHAGTSRRPWYAYDVGAWRVLVVDANCSVVGCGAKAAQTRWVARQLAAKPRRCTALAMHQPRFSSDELHGDHPAADAIWRAAYRGGVDLVLAGHAHDYERIGPLGLGGRPWARGPVLFVVGTGGGERRGWGTVTPASKKRINNTSGLLRLTLAKSSWRAAFLAAPSGKVRDRASGHCR